MIETLILRFIVHESINQNIHPQIRKGLCHDLIGTVLLNEILRNFPTFSSSFLRFTGSSPKR